MSKLDEAGLTSFFKKTKSYIQSNFLPKNENLVLVGNQIEIKGMNGNRRILLQPTTDGAVFQLCDDTGTIYYQLAFNSSNELIEGIRNHSTGTMSYRTLN